MIGQILSCLIGISGLTFLVYILIDVITDLQPSLYSNFKYSRRQMRKKVASRKEWEADPTTSHDIELSFESFKKFVDLTTQGWTWKKEYGVYCCNPCFQPDRKTYYYVRFKTYRDYVKAAAYCETRSKLESKRKQELAETKNMAEFIAIQKQRAKEAEEQAARQMRESEEQIMEILERLKNESVIPTLTPPTPSASVSVTDKGKTITLSDSPDMYGWKV